MTETEDKDAKVQAIFDKVIKAYFYPIPNETTHWMCEALWLARRHNIVSRDEQEYAVHAIKDYLKGHLTLRAFLKGELNLPNSIEDRLKIYQNWSDRPQSKEN